MANNSSVRFLPSVTRSSRANEGRGSQRITYATSISHATIAATQGPEAVYALKAGLKNSADKLAANVRLTVSGAQKKAFEDAQVKKRGREELVEEDDEDDEDEEEEPALKKGKGKEKVVVEPGAFDARGFGEANKDRCDGGGLGG